MEEPNKIKKEYIDHESDFCFVPPALDIAEALEEAIDSMASGSVDTADPLGDTSSAETPSEVANEADIQSPKKEISELAAVITKTEDCEPSAPANVWENEKCIFCQNVLTPTLEPKLLECLHSGCNACVQSKLNPIMTDTTELVIQELRCDLCNVSCDPALITDNRFLLEAAASAQPSSNEPSPAERLKDLKCQSCAEAAACTSWCVECGEFICDACVQAHQRLKITKDHTIKAKEEGDLKDTLGSTDSSPDVFCSVHLQEKLSLFCETCDKLTCRDCQLTDHRQHKYKFINEMATETKHLIKGLLSEVSYKRVLLKSAMKVIDDRQNLIGEKKRKLTQEITEMVKLLTNAINLRGKQLAYKLNEVCESKQKTLNEKKVTLEQLSRLTDHCIEFVNNGLSTGSDMALLSSKANVMHHLQRIKSRRADIPNPEIPVRIALVFEKISDLAKVVSNIGSLMVDGRVYQSANPSRSAPSPGDAATPPQPSPPPPRLPPPYPVPNRMSPLQAMASQIPPYQQQVQQAQGPPPQQQRGTMHHQAGGHNGMGGYGGQHAGPQGNPYQMLQNYQHVQAQAQAQAHAAQAHHVAMQQHHQATANQMAAQMPTLMKVQTPTGAKMVYRNTPPGYMRASMYPQGSAGHQARMMGAHHPPHQQHPQVSTNMNNGNHMMQDIKPFALNGGQMHVMMPHMGGGGAPGGALKSNSGSSYSSAARSLVQRVNTSPLSHGTPQWHIPQTGTHKRSSPSTGASPSIPEDTSYKITLKSPSSTSKSVTPPSSNVHNKEISPVGGGGQVSVTSTSSSLNKTPSPHSSSSTGSGGKPDEVQVKIDQFCQDSVNDLMATIAKLDSNGISITREGGDGKLRGAGVQAADSSTSSVQRTSSTSSKDEGDPNEDWCAVCMDGGELMCCDKCPKVFHIGCHIPSLTAIPNEHEQWQCSLCTSIEVEVSEVSQYKDRTKRAEFSPAELKICQRILLELYAQYDQSLHFRHVVSQEDKVYHEKVKSPMSLDVVRWRLNPSHPEGYKTILNFISDIRLIFKNAFSYFGKTDVEYSDAKSLEEYFEHMLEKWLPDYAYDESILSDGLGSGSEEPERKRARRSVTTE